jgi:tellurite resistance protein
MSSTRIQRLRDKLVGQGRPSIVPAPWPPAEGQGGAADVLYSRLRPVAEAMYLVMAADTQIGDRERAALLGALRILTEGKLSSAAMDAMLAEFARELARQGRELRLDHVASALYGDAADVELALALVAAASLADGHASDAEYATIEALADRLGLAPERVRALIEQGD